MSGGDERDESSWPWVVHGSPDSLDVDLAFFCQGRETEPLPSFRRCQLFCAAGAPNENRNLFRVEEGVVVACFKGLPDEGNNSILSTFGYHQQRHPLPITRKVKRLVPLKVVRAVRALLSRVTRTQYRAKVKQALRQHDLCARLACLRQVSFAQVEFLDTIEEAKAIALQLGQTIALMAGRELYTKGEVGQMFPALQPFLQRQRDRVPMLLFILDRFKELLLECLHGIQVMDKKESLNLLRWPAARLNLDLPCSFEQTSKQGDESKKEKEKEKDEDDEQEKENIETELFSFERESYDGFIVDMRTERCLFYPPTTKNRQEDNVLALYLTTKGSDEELHFASLNQLDKDKLHSPSFSHKVDHRRFFSLWQYMPHSSSPSSPLTSAESERPVLRLLSLRSKLTNEDIPLCELGHEAI
ncbi:hypothetical protein QOT17_005050 [Balamuthia mandrillaris]